MTGDKHFSVRSLLIFISIIAALLAQPKLAMSVGATVGSVFFSAQLVLAIRDAWHTTDKSDRRLVLPYSIILAVFVMASLFWGVLTLGSFLALFR